MPAVSLVTAKLEQHVFVLCADVASDHCLSVAYQQVTNIGCGTAHRVMHSECTGQSNQLFMMWANQPEDSAKEGVMLTSRYYTPGIEQLCLTTNSEGNIFMTGCDCKEGSSRNKWYISDLQQTLTVH